MTRSFWKRKVKDMEVELMNARQAARAAATRIEELEHYQRMATHDIRQYNKVIMHMIQHGSPCDYCNDLEECREAGKDVSIGCDMWMLRFADPEAVKQEIAVDGVVDLAGRGQDGKGADADQ
jgi:hypothetical protein